MNLDIDFNDLINDSNSILKVDKQWCPLYYRREDDEQRIFIGNAVIDLKYAEKYMQTYSWNLNEISDWSGHIFNWGFIYSIDSSGYVINNSYHGKLKPLLYERCFDNQRDSFFEVLEEFRLFLNLYQRKDKDDENYYILGNNDDDIEVIKFDSGNCFIRKTYLQDYLFKTKRAFIISFLIERYFQKTLEELSLEECGGDNIRTASDNLLIFNYARFEPYIKEKGKSSSRAEGKKLFYGKKIENLFGKEEYIDFIVDIDENNQEKRLSCKQKDEDIHLKLTLIFFKKDVLKKYYDNPKCTIYPGCIEHPAWRLQIDNDHNDHIAVYLYKLACLPHQEQLYWRSYNVPAEGKKMSLSFFSSTIMGEFSYPEQSVNKFKWLYPQINLFWQKSFSFELYSALHQDDKYNLDGLNDIINNENDLDRAMQSLTKVMIGAVNEKEIINQLIQNGDKIIGGINRLERFLEKQTIIESAIALSLIKQLRDIQDFRSKSTAHNKGHNYDKLVTEDPKIKSNPQEAFREILNNLNSIFIKILSPNAYTQQSHTEV